VSLLQDLDAAQSAIAPRIAGWKAPIGVVLGSGLGGFGDGLEGLVKVPYADIPNMPRSTVAGHAGNLCLGASRGVPLLCLQGRVHAYEGHELDRVVFAVRLLARLGARAVLLTNAAGGIHASLVPGDLMLIADHINLMGRSPLVGANDAGLGPRFPDMTHAYDRGLRVAARAAALESGVTLREGVYAGLLGPTYETPAEVRMLRTLGADAVGMSTVPEVIALNHMGIPVAGVSCITNLAAGISPTKLDHAEVEETAKRTRATFTKFLAAWIERAAAPAAQG